MLKRYDLVWHYESGEGYIDSIMEVPDGDCYLVSDVEREYIPRPDAEEARKAVDDLILAYQAVGKNTSRYRQARAAVLKLMGVE